MFSCFFFFLKTHWAQLVPGCGVIHMCMVNLPGNIFLKKIDSPSPSYHQMSTALKLGVGTMPLLCLYSKANWFYIALISCRQPQLPESLCVLKYTHVQILLYLSLASVLWLWQCFHNLFCEDIAIFCDWTLDSFFVLSNIHPQPLDMFLLGVLIVLDLLWTFLW